MTRKGLGSVYQTKSGQWRGSIEVGYSDGKRRRKTVTGRNSTEVTEKLRALHATAKTTGSYVRPVDSESLEAYLLEWLESAVRAHKAHRTWEQYELTARLHVLPELGAYKLAEITPQICQRWIASLMRTEGNNVARFSGVMLKNALGRAMKWGLLTHNPMGMVDMPTVRVKETRIWTPDQARAFLEVCRCSEWGPVFIVILSLALRKGEALALQWQDVDIERRLVHIRATLERKDGALRRKPPKTAGSARILHLPQLALQAFEKAQEARNGADWCFHTRTGQPFPHQNLYRPFGELCRIAGVPQITIHGLRHTTASIMLAQGTQLHVVSKYLGHSSPTITLRVYAHVLAQQAREVADVIDEMYA